MSVFDGIRERMMSKVMGTKAPALENISDQTNDEQTLVAYVRERVEESRSSGNRIANEGIWMTNTAYLLGFDSVYYDTQTRQYKPTGGKASMARGRIHVNEILPTIQNRLARLTKSPPKYEVKPESDSIEDKDAAELGEQIIDDIWDRQKVNKKRLSLVMWLQQCGYAYLKVSWDPLLGKPMVNLPSSDDPVEGIQKPIEEQTDEAPHMMNAQSPANLLGYEGDIRIDVCSAFEIFQDPLAKSDDDVNWYIQAKVRKLDYFREMFPSDEGMRGDLVKEEGAWLLSSQYEMRINSLTNSNPTSGGTEPQMKNAAIELAYYEKRSRKYPNGRLVITANGVLLHDGELPVGELPFVKFDDTIIGGKFAPESIITHLRPLQDQYNRTMRKRADWVNACVAGKYIAAKGHGMSAESFNNASAEILEYNPVPGGAMPQAVQIPNIPQWVYNEGNELKELIGEISAIGQLSKGQLPQAGIPAIGMQFLQEQDETRLGVITEQHEQGYAQVGSLMLKYGQKFFITKRILKLSGSGRKYTVKSFVGADIRDNHDVSVVRGSTLPNSTTLKRQELLNAYQLGILGPAGQPETIQKLIDGMQYGDEAVAWSDYNIDCQMITEHLAMIKSEEAPPVNEFDNHELFVLRLNRVRKTDEYSSMTTQSQFLLNQCMEAHLQAIINRNNPGLQQQTQLAQEMTKEGLSQTAQHAQGMQQLASSPPGAPPPPGVMSPDQAPGGPAGAALQSQNNNLGARLQAEAAQAKARSA